MNLTLSALRLTLRKQSVSIELEGLRYFYGPIGSGKSSIGRLVNYCLGGNIELTPALQQEFTSAELFLRVNYRDLALTRDRDSDSLLARWKDHDGSEISVVIPARKADGEVLSDTGVEVLSDLLFYLADETPPRVRRRKGRPDELLERLSFRDLFQFCYLDQRGIDSDFFRLTSENYAVKQKTVDTLRYILAYATERVAELEARLQAIKEDRFAASGAATGLIDALKESGFEDVLTINTQIAQTRQKIEKAEVDAKAARASRGTVPHAADELRTTARSLALDIQALEHSLDEIDSRRGALIRQANELKMLSIRYERTASARAVLGGVDFIDCPRCSQHLPVRDDSLCVVCGQAEPTLEERSTGENRAVAEDVASRQRELAEAVGLLEGQRRVLTRRLRISKDDKEKVEKSLSMQMRDYDSAFLSQALQKERDLATFQEELRSLERYVKLPAVVAELNDKVGTLIAKETALKAELEEARKNAFLDRRSLKRLAAFFIDCLCRSKFPDVKPTDEAEIDASNFYPRISLGQKNGLVDLTFENAGSGGMMALFKTCFALALHRFSAASKFDRLPSLLMIDTPTKNVSSKENPEVIEAFFGLVYQLAETELSGLQIVIIENEYTGPESKELPINVRHMIRGSADNPPLVPYLSGEFE